MKIKDIRVKDLMALLRTCNPEGDIWVTTPEDDDLDPDTMSVVADLSYVDHDDEMSREIARKLGFEFLREPILRIVPNE